jgi:hypothetical protein
MLNDELPHLPFVARLPRQMGLVAFQARPPVSEISVD